MLVLLGCTAWLVRCNRWPAGNYEYVDRHGKTVHFRLSHGREDWLDPGDGQVTGDFQGKWKYLDKDRRVVGVAEQFSRYMFMDRCYLTRTDRGVMISEQRPTTQPADGPRTATEQP